MMIPGEGELGCSGLTAPGPLLELMINSRKRQTGECEQYGTCHIVYI